MPSCAFLTCRNRHGSNNQPDGITFHRFPGEEKMKLKWTEIIRRARLDDFWKPSKYSVICSAHFKDEYFYRTKKGFRKLREKALPTKVNISFYLHRFKYTAIFYYLFIYIYLSAE